MAKFYAKSAAVFQKPIEKIASDGSRSSSMGFCVAICNNGCGDEAADAYNAEQIVRCLNQDDEIKEIATWLLKQKTLYINEKRRKLLEEIVK